MEKTYSYYVVFQGPKGPGGIHIIMDEKIETFEQLGAVRDHIMGTPEVDGGKIVILSWTELKA